MFTINIAYDLSQELKSMLNDAGGDACFRLKEYQTAPVCCAPPHLGIAIDTPNNEDEIISYAGMKFIANYAFLAQYGKEYQIVVKDKLVTLIPLSQPE